jgi:hypothetical protein
MAQALPCGGSALMVILQAVAPWHVGQWLNPGTGLGGWVWVTRRLTERHVVGKAAHLPGCRGMMGSFAVSQ